MLSTKEVKALNALADGSSRSIALLLTYLTARQPVGLSGEIGRKREGLGARQVNMARLSVEPVAQDLHASNVQTLVYKRLWVGFPVAVYDLDIVEDKIVLKLCN